MELKNYIRAAIFPAYRLADEGHRQDHIEYVISRSLRFARMHNVTHSHTEAVDLNMVYAIAAFHDIGLTVADRSIHEIVSAQMLRANDMIQKYFTQDQINIMAEAIEDHRASLKTEPRSVYGKIISQADRDTSADSFMMRMFVYRKDRPEFMYDFMALKRDMRTYMTSKYGPDGCGLKKIWFQDDEFDAFVERINLYINNDYAFTCSLKQIIAENDITACYRYTTRAIAE